MKKTLPKTVFVYRKEYDAGTESLVACEKAEEALENEVGTVRVGKYELVGYADVKAIPTVLPVKK